eukprot:scaffold2227_cov168-Amphora_coffeaeformis.AAC.2
MEVPTSVLKDFLASAKQEVESLVELERPLSAPMVRGLLLERQNAVLERIVADYNNNRDSVPLITVAAVKQALQNIISEDHEQEDDSLSKMSQELNEAARLAYARLLLYSACRKRSEQSLREQMALKASGSIERKDLMDLFALCQTAVRLPFVTDHISKAAPLFPDLEPTQDPAVVDDTPPQKRLERIQRLFLGELGYDSEFGTQEIKRIFFTPNESNEFTGDLELSETFSKTMTAMQACITEAGVQASISKFSDVESGGVTRVVAVDYSEKDDDTGTPHGQTMAEQNEEQQRQQLRVASQAAALQQQILQEVLSMSEDVRKVKLADAERVSKDFLERVTKVPPGPERVEVLRSIDEPTQRLMAMHKLWEAHVAASNKGEAA